MMFYTDDPVADYARYDAEQDKQIEKLPVCDYCNKHIQDDYYFEIDDEIFCEKCMEEVFRKEVNDYVG